MTKPPVLLAQSLAAQEGANPSRNRTSSRPWYFALSFLNAFTVSNGRAVSTFQMDITDKAEIIKRAALKRFKDAYSGVPVTVYEGTVGDATQEVMNHDRDTGIPGCGQNDTFARLGRIGYVKHMEEAQLALGVVITSTQDAASVFATRPDYIQSIGTGIGVAAAHETAHSFLTLCCSMHSDPWTDPAAKATYNASSCGGITDPSMWLGYWPANYRPSGAPPQTNPQIPLHWQQPALVGLGQCLGGGWKARAGSACHQ